MSFVLYVSCLIYTAFTKSFEYNKRKVQQRPIKIWDFHQNERRRLCWAQPALSSEKEALLDTTLLYRILSKYFHQNESWLLEAILPPVLLFTGGKGEQAGNSHLMKISHFCRTLRSSLTVASYSNENFSFKWELPTCPHPLSIAPLFWWKERGIKGSSHLNENLSFE